MFRWRSLKKVKNVIFVMKFYQLGRCRYGGHKKSRVNGKKKKTAGSIVLSDLLRSVGIGICNAASEEGRSACKKCARKISNCFTMFHELESAVKARIDEGNSESTEGGIKRLHGNSPSGSTPNSKKIKDIPQQVQEPREPKGRSRKLAFLSMDAIM